MTCDPRSSYRSHGAGNVPSMDGGYGPPMWTTSGTTRETGHSSPPVTIWKAFAIAATVARPCGSSGKYGEKEKNPEGNSLQMGRTLGRPRLLPACTGVRMGRDTSRPDPPPIPGKFGRWCARPQGYVSMGFFPHKEILRQRLICFTTRMGEPGSGVAVIL